METCNQTMLFVYYVVLMFLSFQVSDVSSSTDFISTNQPLQGTRTLISNGEIFEFGLFLPDPVTDKLGLYIGIWYKRVSPQITVWVADRDRISPRISLRSFYILKISNGNLILCEVSSGKTIWSTGIKSSSNKDVRAVLLDNGNLVLRDGPTSSAAVLWQSFDYPTNIWLPEAKLKLGSSLLTSWKTSTDPSRGQYSLEVDHNTKHSLITVWNGSKSYWSSGPWDVGLKTFKGLSAERGSNFSFQWNLNESYITYSVDSNSTYHMVIDHMGVFKLEESEDYPEAWLGMWSKPDNICEIDNCCGSFGICNKTAQACTCVPGFRTATEKEFDFSGGCKRETKLQCDMAKTNFRPIKNMKLATDPTTLIATPNLITTCTSACLNNCSCNAYAYDDNKCLMWTKDAFNLQQLNASKGHTFFLKVAVSNITTAPLYKDKSNQPKGRNIVLLVTLSTISLLASAAFLVGLYCCVSSRRRIKRTHKDEKQRREILGGGIIDEDGEHMCYLNLHDIKAATNDFSEENKLGEGGFGPVYKGKLLNGMDVAIKRLSKKSNQGLTEFKNEVVLIIKLQHKNLVRLLGYCVEDDEKLLIYEYMSNKSLDVLLFDSLKCRELDWETRMKIVNGTTRELQYLHEYSRLRIIHRDLKASNILLDDEMNPKISDFGTARIFGCKQINDSTQRIVGTFGYMSPEYALGGMISEKSDIYSFGVLLLEIISGKKATRFMHNDQKHSLIAHTWESWCETKGVSIIDEALCGSYSIKEVMRCVHIALLCVQDHPNTRPTISQIVYMLSNDKDLSTPKQPTFSNVLNGNQESVSSDYVFSINEVTQTELEARLNNTNTWLVNVPSCVLFDNVQYLVEFLK